MMTSCAIVRLRFDRNNRFCYHTQCREWCRGKGLRPNSDSAGNACLLVNRTSTGGCPGSWSGSSWNGWLVRFSNGKLAIDFPPNGWRDPKDDAGCVMASYPSGNNKDGNWHYLAVTRDASKKVSLYWDGKLLAAKTLSNNQNVASTARLSIGGQDSSNSFSGDYDEVMVFKRALSADEIAAECAATRPAEENGILPTPDGHWTFDEIVEEDGKKLFKDLGVNGAHRKSP